MKYARSVMVLAAVVVAGALFPAAASVQGSFQRSYKVSGPVNLDVLTRSGDVTVHAGPAGTVTVSGKIHVGDSWFSGNRMDTVRELEKNPPITQSGNSIRIDYVNERNISIDYEITAPAETTLHARTGSGDQRIEGIHGNSNLESGSGDMELASLQGDLQVHTGSGNVQARDIAGAFTAEAGSGDIRLEEKSAGDVRVHTGSGNIEVRGVNGALNLEAGSGDVTAEGAIPRGWEIRTGSGDVSLRVPENAGFDLEAHTSSGTVDVTQPVTMVVQGNMDHARRSVEGKVRGGGPTLSVRTGSGDISIR